MLSTVMEIAGDVEGSINGVDNVLVLKGKSAYVS